MSSNEPTPAAVLYAAKSTDDVGGSLGSQIERCREAAEREGREIVGEYSDEAESGYRKSRGRGLQQAMDHAERLAAEHGTAELWVMQSYRLARGDGKTAKHLAQYWFWAYERDVTLRSVEDDQNVSDLLYAAITGKAGHDDSKAKGAYTRAGKQRRFEAGASTGPLHDGYRLEPDLDDDGRRGSSTSGGML
jgi:DNA invertase Pin-like site-specific DNA recombinase